MPEVYGSVRTTRRKLADNIASLYILQGLNYIIPMAVLPYLVRVLGMGMYGLLAFAQSFALYFTILTDYGFNFSATRKLAQHHQDAERVSRLFSSVLVLKLLLGLLGWLILLAIVALIPRFHHDAPYFYAGYLAVLGNVLFPVWFFQGIQQMRYISIVSGITRLVAAFALFVFVHRPQDTLLALVIQSGGMLLSGVIGIAIVLLRFRVKLVQPSRSELWAALNDGWHLFVSTAAISLYTNTNVFLVGILAGNVEAGYFSVAEKVVRAMNGLLSPISQAIFPHVNALAQESRATVLRFSRRVLSYLIPLTTVPSLVLLLFPGPIVHFCFGAGGGGSVAALRWIAMLPVLLTISNILGIQTMIPFGLDKQFSRILVCAGLLNVTMAIPLVKLFGAEGAGASVFITETFVTLCMMVLLERYGLSIFRPERVA